MARMLIICCALLLLCTGCSSSRETITIATPKIETVYVTPDIIARPTMVKLELYDTRYGLDEPGNFKRFQKNTIKLVNHIRTLERIIDSYERSITDLKQIDKK